MNIPAYVIWLAAAILFGILEAVMLGLNSIWFSVGALAALLAAKKLLKKRFNRARQPTNADRILGETVIVTEEINNEKPSGQIRAGSIFWTARSIDGTVIPKDAEVTVKYIDGVKAMVERA